jgi:group I intron endonuclease
LNSGIYIIKNLVTNDFYLGSTVDFNKRKNAHFNQLRKGEHHSPILQRSYKKHGKNNFIFKIIHEEINEYLRDLEQLYLYFLIPKYNICLDAIAPMMNRKHSKAAIKKFKKRKVRKGKDHHLYGTMWSEELRKKILEKRIGLKRSAETRLKMSRTAKRINSISRVDFSKIRKPIIDNLKNEFKSLTEAALFHKISPCIICDNLKGRSQMTHKKIRFAYANNIPKDFFENKEKIVNHASQRKTYVYDINFKLLNEFNSLTKAAKFYNFSYGQVKYFRIKAKPIKGLLFSYEKF